MTIHNERRKSIGVATFDMRHDHSISEMVETVARLGVDLLELPYDPANRELDDVERLCGEHGIHLFSVGPVAPAYRINAVDDPEEVQDVIKTAMRFAQSLGATYVNIGPGPNASRDPFATLELMPRLLDPLLSLAEDLNLTIVIENHFDMYAEDPAQADLMRTPERLLSLFERVDSPRFKYVFDPANFTIAGEEPWPLAFDLLRPYTDYIHLKDVRHHSDLLGPHSQYRLLTDSRSGAFFAVALGEGAVNYAPMLRQIVLAEERWPLILEGFTLATELESTLARSLQYVEATLASAESED